MGYRKKNPTNTHTKNDKTLARDETVQNFLLPLVTHGAQEWLAINYPLVTELFYHLKWAVCLNLGKVTFWEQQLIDRKFGFGFLWGLNL